MSSKTIFLTGDMRVNIEGKTFTVNELKNHVIDSILYKKHLKNLIESQEV